MRIFSSRIVQELVDECLSVGAFFMESHSMGRSTLKRRRHVILATLPREKVSFRLVVYIVATALLAFGSLQ